MCECMFAFYSLFIGSLPASMLAPFLFIIASFVEHKSIILFPLISLWLMVSCFMFFLTHLFVHALNLQAFETIVFIIQSHVFTLQQHFFSKIMITKQNNVREYVRYLFRHCLFMVGNDLGCILVSLLASFSNCLGIRILGD